MKKLLAALALAFSTSILMGSSALSIKANQLIVHIPVPAPLISSISPSTGAVGSTVVITGAYFGVTQDSSTVSVNGVPVIVSSWSDTSITFTVPSTTTGSIVVTRSQRTSNGTVFTVTSNASIFGFAANISCPTTGGQTVVNVTNGQNLGTIVNAQAANTTIVVHAGTYAGFTATVSGASGQPITICGNPDDSAVGTVILTSAITVSSRTWLTIQGLKFTSQCIQAADGGNGAGHTVTTNHLVVQYDSCILPTASTGNVVGMYFFANNSLISQIEMVGTNGDCIDLGGDSNVVRSIYCHDLDAGPSGQHIDFVQKDGGVSPDVTNTLVESIIYQNVDNSTSNAAGAEHFNNWGSSAGHGSLTKNNIWRYTYGQNIGATHGGSGLTFGGSSASDQLPSQYVYHNTIATEDKTDPNTADGITFQQAPNSRALNNIFYNTTNGASPTGGSSTGLVYNGNLAFTVGFAGSWGSPYSSEVTYAALHNHDPLFANYPTDCTLQGGSPAAGTAQPLTTVGGSDTGSGTTLILSDAGFFQPGWAGTQGDVIRIGALIGSPNAQITAVNYATNTVTLSTTVNRTVGDPVYLLKDSSGTLRITAILPNIGACQ